MRIWDVHPGYLNRQSLLGEHRELHGLVNVLTKNRKGYSRHPETLRWVGYGWAIRQRHALLAAEMKLRGYQDSSPVRTRSAKNKWPEIYIDPPYDQFEILRMKYKDKEPGRIPLPKNAQQLWSHHKYSVMARDPKLYKSIGQRVSAITSKNEFSQLALQLISILRTEPTQGTLFNALQHMWGYVSDSYPHSSSAVNEWSHTRLLATTQKLALQDQQTYLLHSTALSELMLFART